MRCLNLDQLRTFVEVIERHSFTAAAKELNLTQPAVTLQVQALERRFNVALVARIRKRVYLTQAGEKLIEHARQLLDEDSIAQLDMRRFVGELGRVRIGTNMTVLIYVLPPILRRLKTDYPQLEINLKEGVTSTTLQMLMTNALDLGLCSLPVEDPAFETTPLFDDELVAILPAKLNGVPKKVTPAFLSRCPLILGHEDSAFRRTVTDWLALTGAPPPKPVMEFDHVEAIKSTVAVGLGASLVPRLSLGTGHVSAANMLVRPLNPPVSRPIRLVRLRGRRSTEGVELVFAALLALRRQREDALRRSTSNRADRSERCPSPTHARTSRTPPVSRPNRVNAPPRRR